MANIIGFILNGVIHDPTKNVGAGTSIAGVRRGGGRERKHSPFRKTHDEKSLQTRDKAQKPDFATFGAGDDYER